MKLFLVVAAVVGLCVILLGVGIFFFGREFPNGEVSQNEELRKKGIRCMNEVDAEIHKKFKNESCSNCRETECGKVHTVQPPRGNEAGDSR